MTLFTLLSVILFIINEIINPIKKINSVFCVIEYFYNLKIYDSMREYLKNSCCHYTNDLDLIYKESDNS